MQPNDKRDLESAISIMGLTDSSRILERTDRFIRLLQEWNGRINLISRQDVSRLMGRHILESMGLITAVDFPTGSHVVDIGTGAGFPGVPLAIVRPDLQITLIESKRKKSLFLQKVVQELGLDNVQIVLGRVEDVGSDIDQVDFVISRAVTHLATLCDWSLPLFENRSGILIAMKGMDVQKELTDLKEQYPSLVPDIIPFHPFPDQPDIRAGQLIQIQCNADWT